MSSDVELNGPDLTRGVPLSEIPDGGMLLGHAGGKPVLVARRGARVDALDAQCTHYSANLADGLIVGDTLRCPWHHACFSLETGEALKAPALRPLTRWNLERRDGKVFVVPGAADAGMTVVGGLDRALKTQAIVIVGAGAAGDAAADMLRRQGHAGPLTMIGDDSAPPVDRPNLSKDYLAGNAPEEWIPLRDDAFYRQRGINLVLGRRVTRIDRAARTVALDDGSAHSYDTLLLATGASPVRLPEAVTGGRVRYLRTLADTRAIIDAAKEAKRAVVIGASFIGLEVAASLRMRGLEVHVVAPEEHPLERVMGRDVSDFIRALHERKGVIFHLGRTMGRRDETGVVLDDGQRIEADLVVAGVGVRPNDQLATEAGLDVDKGVLVNAFLQTSDPAIYAAGDIARYPDPRTGERIRVEHWVVAQRQAQAAALNMLGARRRFADVPFFWSQHYDVPINYVGHASRWDDVQVEGSIEQQDALVRYRLNGQTLAVATIGRDRAALEAELAMERATTTTAGNS